MSQPVQVPADVEREDKLVGQLTARQLVVIAVTAVAVFGVWRWCGPSRLVVFVAVSVPIVLLGVAFTVGERDGTALDRLLWAGLRQRAALRSAGPPRVLARRPRPTAPGDSARSRDSAAGSGRAVVAPLPLRGVRAVGSDGLGVLDLGGAGSAVVCTVSPVNLWLRSGPEQDAAVAGFARWVQSLAAPVQVLTRTRPLDLSGPVTRLRHAVHGPAPTVADAALVRAALAHAEHLRALDARSELLHREFLIVFRTPRTPGRAAREHTDTARASTAGAAVLRRRAIEAAALLGPVGLRVTPLRAHEAAAVLRRATAPATTLRPAQRPEPRHGCGSSWPAGLGDAPTVELPALAPFLSDPNGPDPAALHHRAGHGAPISDGAR